MQSRNFEPVPDSSRRVQIHFAPMLLLIARTCDIFCARAAFLIKVGVNVVIGKITKSLPCEITVSCSIIKTAADIIYAVCQKAINSKLFMRTMKEVRGFIM